MISKPNFFIRRKDEKAFHNLPYSSQEVYVDNGYTRQYKTVETTFHIDTLRRAMNDRPELFPEIEKVRYPNKKDLVGVISKYNKLDSKELNATIDSNSDFEVELLKEGKINLYVSKNQTAGNQFYIQKGPGTKLIELPFANQPDTYIQGQLIRSYQHSTTNHIDSLKKYMADALLLHPMIENISIPTKSKLINLIDEYNSYTDESSYIQKHTIKRLPLNVEITPGLYFTFINAGNRIDKYGSYINIGFTNKNKHCFAKTGLFAYNGNTPLTDRYYIENGRYFPPATTYKIPLQFEYRFTNTAVQPCLSFGYNLYFFDEIAPFNISLMPAVAPGLNIRLAGRLSVHFNLELEFTNGSLLAYYPKSLKMGSLFTGLQIKL
ncbi:MAG TPA: hypothetical protein VK152_13175 [Paludibacter sp.]|nr:hypothetical protein [Paludibacter sp.]